MSDISDISISNKLLQLVLLGFFFLSSFILSYYISFDKLLILIGSILVTIIVFRIPEMGFALFLLIGVLKNVTSKFPIDLTLLLFVLTSFSLILKFSQRKMKCDFSNKYFLTIISFAFLVIVGLFFSKAPQAGLLKTSRFISFNIFLFIGGLSIGSSDTSSKRFINILFILLFVYGLVYVYFFKDVIGMNIKEFADYHLRFTLIGNPIGVGRIFSVMVIISLIYFLREKSNKIIYMIGILLGLIITLATNSRGPLVALILTIFIYLALFSEIEKKKILMIALVLLIVFISLLSILPKNFVSRYTFGLSKEVHISKKEIKVFSTSKERETYLAQSISYLSRNPHKILFGIGTGSFSYISKNIDARLYPHNIFIEIILEFGIVGILLFILPFIFLIIDFIRYRHTFSGYSYSNLVLWIVLTILFFLNAQVSGDINDNRLLWFFEGGVIGLILSAKKNINTINNTIYET